MINYMIIVPYVLLLIMMGLQSQDVPKLSNLDAHCFRCLCYAATGCNMTFGCVKGYCGPYKISKLYWKDAGQVTLLDDDVERAGAYEDCALNYSCAQKLVTNYIVKYAKDCNDDGVTDCYDYSMINFNGGFQCHPSLDRSEPGKLWLERYHRCNPKSF